MVDWTRTFQGQVKIRSLQKKTFFTAQRIILLLPSLIMNNIYFVIYIGPIQSYFRHWHLILSPETLLVDISLYQHTDVLLVYSYMLCMYKPFLAITVLVVTPILPGQASFSGLTLQIKLLVAVDPWANTGLSTRSTTSYYPCHSLPKK